MPVEIKKWVAIVQSCYIPWKGYFDLINRVDEFILFDSVQYTKRDWRNRNKIKTANGCQWLSIPVCVKGRYAQPINQVDIADPLWAEQHWQTIRHAYAKAPCFNQFRDPMQRLFEQAADETRLTQANLVLLQGICTLLGINTTLILDTAYDVSGQKTERLLNLCEAAQASHYLSGPKARNYIDPEDFSEKGIELAYIDYSHYPPYSQLHGEFVHEVSVLDLIFNTGANAGKYISSTPVVESDAEKLV